MNLIKKYFLWILLFASIGFWGYIQVTQKAPCEVPIEYSIGSLDSRFNISKKTLIKSLFDAEQIWEKTLGKNLFVYNETAKFKINLVYDSRQEMANKNTQIESQIKDIKVGADSIKERFTSLQNQFKKASAEYESALSDFRVLQNRYNEKVKYWNSQGGAPKSEYESLNREKNNLALLQIGLETKRLEVNGLAEEINTLVKNYNYLVKDINSNINVINQSADKEFEEGEYLRDKTGERINIYEFKDIAVLTRVLSHELGHSIGLGHNENKNSIMYYLNNSKNIVPTMEDVRDLRLVCGVK